MGRGMGGSASLFGRLPTRLSGNRAIGVMACVTLAGGLLVAPLGHAAASAAGPCDPPVPSVIACENSLPGSTAWQIQGAGDPTIQGFATSISVTANSTVHFKINTDASAYHVDIFRLGYYGGDGARLVASDIAPTASLPQSQPPCLEDASTGLIDCGDWAESASWAVPSTAVSGVYLALLTRTDTGGQSEIPFVVKDPASHSSIIFQTSDATWQAYNSYGGNSLYTGDGSLPDGRAYKVSYNRPFDTADTHPTSWLLNNEFPMISFLERNGFDVSYETAGDVDADTGGTLLQNHQVFMSVGHDEYWSGNQRANVQAARDAGVNLAFFSGNLMFWKTRWESSVDGTNTARRTLVSYKETHDNALIDPQDPPTWTGTWRDPRFTPQSDGGQPENSLTGQLGLDSDARSYTMTVPSKYKALRFWRNTSIPSLAPGAVANLAPNTLGDEFDVDVDNGFRPAGLIDMSSTTIDSPGVFRDYGTTLEPGTATNSITLYKASSGALVFDTGTIQWSFGLDPGVGRIRDEHRHATGHGQHPRRHERTAGVVDGRSRPGVEVDRHDRTDDDDHVAGGRGEPDERGERHDHGNRERRRGSGRRGRGLDRRRHDVAPRIGYQQLVVHVEREPGRRDVRSCRAPPTTAGTPRIRPRAWRSRASARARSSARPSRQCPTRATRVRTSSWV